MQATILNVADAVACPELSGKKAVAYAGRAVRSGGVPPFTFAGCGIHGAVFCDRAGNAWKVYHRNTTTAALREAMFFADMFNAYPEFRKYLPKFVQYVPSTNVVLRQCIPGVLAAFVPSSIERVSSIARTLRDAADRIDWKAFDVDIGNFLVGENGDVTLIDAGAVKPIRNRLVILAKEALAGLRPWWDKPDQVALAMTHSDVDPVLAEGLVRAIRTRGLITQSWANHYLAEIAAQRVV